MHIHSRYSNDGEWGTGEIMNRCCDKGIDIFSITDHNSVKGSREAANLAASYQNLEFIPGLEIDCTYRGTDLHLLAYQVDLNGNEFDDLEKSVRQKYLDAVPQMIRNLEQLGLYIDRDELMQRSGGDAPSGELFAELLFEKSGQPANPVLLPYLPGGDRSDMPLINFYLDFFAQGKPAYVRIEHLEFKEALSLVRDKGGIPIVAHPGLNLKDREEEVGELLDLGAAGLEVFNNYHSQKQATFFAGETSKRGALLTCGSDFHGNIKPRISIGQYLFLEDYRTYLEKSLSSILNHKLGN